MVAVDKSVLDLFDKAMEEQRSLDSQARERVNAGGDIVGPVKRPGLLNARPDDTEDSFQTLMKDSGSLRGRPENTELAHKLARQLGGKLDYYSEEIEKLNKEGFHPLREMKGPMKWMAGMGLALNPGLRKMAERKQRQRLMDEQMRVGQQIIQLLPELRSRNVDPETLRRAEAHGRAVGAFEGQHEGEMLEQEWLEDEVKKGTFTREEVQNLKKIKQGLPVSMIENPKAAAAEARRALTDFTAVGDDMRIGQIPEKNRESYFRVVRRLYNKMGREVTPAMEEAWSVQADIGIANEARSSAADVSDRQRRSQALTMFRGFYATTEKVGMKKMIMNREELEKLFPDVSIDQIRLIEPRAIVEQEVQTLTPQEIYEGAREMYGFAYNGDFSLLPFGNPGQQPAPVDPGELDPDLLSRMFKTYEEAEEFYKEAGVSIPQDVKNLFGRTD